MGIVAKTLNLAFPGGGKWLAQSVSERETIGVVKCSYKYRLLLVPSCVFFAANELHSGGKSDILRKEEVRRRRGLVMDSSSCHPSTYGAALPNGR